MAEFNYEIRIRLRITPRPKSHHTVLQERLIADKELKKHICGVVNTWRERGMQPTTGKKLPDDFCLIDSLTVVPPE
jgi:hypothetical protein